MRANIVMATLHPEVWGSAILWQKNADFRRDTPGVRVLETAETVAEEGVLKQVDYAKSTLDVDAYMASPIHQVIDLGETAIRGRIDPAMAEFAYPIYRDFATQGATDYLACALVFSTGVRSAVTWLTDKEGGFSDDDIALLHRVAKPLALILEIHAQRRVTRTLLDTYLGKEPGELVLAGKIRPGDVERIEAAIWFSDLRGFTELTASMDSEAVIGLLNEYFRAVGGAIEAEGAGILKFIGDAVLAIYPAYGEGGAEKACRHLLAAADRANEALDGLNESRREQGERPLDHGIALHFGEVQYGNIGATRRLDFTVIGPAVNLASRIEGLCGKLERRLVLSPDFAAKVDTELQTLGSFELKGIPGAIEVFGVTR